jgi:flagellar hook-associated protein 2
VSVSAVDGAPPSSLTFNVKQLASAASGLTERTWTTPDDAFGTGSLTLTKDGTATVIPAGLTLTETAAAITTSNAGVTASVLQTTPGVYRLALSSTTTGSASGFTLDDGGVPLVLQEITPARDAELRVGGVTITRPTNTISDVLTGVTLTLAKADAWTSDGGSPETITFTDPPVALSVTRDDQGMADRVAALVEALNAASKEVKSLTSADPVTKTRGQLYGDSSVRGLVDRVRTAISGGTAAAALAGVTVSRDGTVLFDKDVFQKALTADPAAVEAALGEAGMAGRLDDVADMATRSATAAPGPGVLTSGIRAREDQISGLKTNILSWDNRLALRQQTLQRQYAALERALGSAQSQGQWLSGQLANLPKWS